MIEARGLTKRFGQVTAVDGLTFSVRPGEVTGFLGRNGAGKPLSVYNTSRGSGTGGVAADAAEITLSRTVRDARSAWIAERL
jgi:ABC-type sugar transport system ATPase subunit